MEGDEDSLSRAWRRIRVSVRCPSRLPTWDAILITAASPQQSNLYQLHLHAAIQRGTISPNTFILSVPDPHGIRIGSGGATLHAIRQLSSHLNAKGDVLAGKRVLLVHAGGDSKRVPWANAIGKAFLPFPYFSQQSPDDPVPSLFDHILAISSLAVSTQLVQRGGLFIMTGDVIPCFDASNIPCPQDGAIVITSRAPLEVATKHGVILSNLSSKQHDQLYFVEDLLQKPSAEEMHIRGAVFPDSTALLDTGIFLVVGKAWENLIKLSLANNDPVNLLLQHSQEMSLYEEIASAWVKSRHDWVKTRPLGQLLVNELGVDQLYHYCAHDLQFLHFGTSEEILGHLSSTQVSHRQFTFITEEDSNFLADSSNVLASKIGKNSYVGEKSLVFNCSLSSGVKVGSGCIVFGIHDEGSYFINIPDNYCIWEVPLKTKFDRVILFCGVRDNPKLTVDQGGIFCGRTWSDLFNSLKIDLDYVWNQNEPQDLWHAKLFSVTEITYGMVFANWLMRGVYNEETLRSWQNAKRISFADIQNLADFQRMHAEMTNHQARVAAEFAKSSLGEGITDRNFSILGREMFLSDEVRTHDIMSRFPSTESASVPASRVHQARADLLRACGEIGSALLYETNAFEAVAVETAAAVSQHIFTGCELGKELCYPIHSTVSLPVRVDFVGGWSDTPPWSIERVGCVLNMSVLLNNTAPVTSHVVLKNSPGILLHDDADNTCFIENPADLNPPFGEDDPFRLVKAALVVTGWSQRSNSTGGLEISTSANVPRGSGLGTSSILAAAVIKALLEVNKGDSSDDNVAKLVLVLEQLMGTGGGWQDQVGGIYPGIKFTTSRPVKPLKFTVESIHVSPELKEELEHRMLLVFTGQVRLAHMVLQKVVTRYLQRDAVLISSIDRLIELAKLGKQALIQGDLDKIGRIMYEAWNIHQELDPFCSNTLVDGMFREIDHLSCGYKLVGAGGGGFGIVMAKNRAAANMIKEVLSARFGDSVQFYNWNLC